MGKFGIDLGIGNIAAGGNIEIVQLEAALKHRRDMAGIVLAAEAFLMGSLEGKAREDGDAVIALLAVDRLMDIAELLERLGGEKRVGNLGLLKAKDVRRVGLQKPGHQRARKRTELMFQVASLILVIIKSLNSVHMSPISQVHK